MSDGPHRSLPMSKKWKRVAERIYNEAYSPEQICEALSAAKDCQAKMHCWSRLVRPLRISQHAVYLKSRSITSENPLAIPLPMSGSDPGRQLGDWRSRQSPANFLALV